MADDNKDKIAREVSGNRDLPNLSVDFFADLLNLPTCKTKGYCSNCGRCER